MQIMQNTHLEKYSWFSAINHIKSHIRFQSAFRKNLSSLQYYLICISYAEKYS